MSSIQHKIKELFASQLSEWELAKANYEGLASVRTKVISFGNFDVRVQFNPARMVSSGAKVDREAIAVRKCFLCAEHRPSEQKGVNAGAYVVLVNPFPIFPEHFTIARKSHIPQQIEPFFSDMLRFAKDMSDYVVFYNGPRCGASAPDHMHFQAGTKGFLPLVDDYFRLKATRAELKADEDTYRMYELKDYLRTVFCIESDSMSAANDAFITLFHKLRGKETEEPMMNVVCLYEEGVWYTFVLPRGNFRPWQYSAESGRQLLVSPATVEMCGVFITPVEEHFERITADDIKDILEQSTKKESL